MALFAMWLLSIVGRSHGLRTRLAENLARRTFRVISIPAKHIEAPRTAVSGLPENLSLGTLMAYEPSAPVNDDLFLFLPGTGNPCGFHSQLMEVVGSGMYALCIPYDNRQTIAAMCNVNRDCYARVRRMAIGGDFAHVHGNNIEERLVSALQYLSRTGSASWARYLEGPAGPPRWRAVRVAGHSQGAGDAAMLGYLKEVARVVQFSGVCDLSDWPRRLPKATPSERFFALASARDGLCPLAMQLPSWRAEGALGEAGRPLRLERREDISRALLDGAHAVVTHIPVPNCESKRAKDCGLKAHESTAANTFAPALSPYAGGLWQALVGI